ncbi:MAG: hypothetical protein H7Y43_09410 [Akkermansiaceae bacterium]|nr:hypothetical protein [Verrucomicrobiales bacterium]
MYEHHSKPLLARSKFIIRLTRSFWVALFVIVASLGLGMVGYHVLEQMPWMDAFVNAAMILSGMGPLTPLHTAAGKLFAGCYALFSGVAFLSSVGLVFAPVAHRLLHKFHLESSQQSKKDERK